MLGTNLRRFDRRDGAPPTAIDWIHMPSATGPRTFVANVPGGALVAAGEGLVFVPGIRATPEGLVPDVLRVQPMEIVRDRSREGNDDR